MDHKDNLKKVAIFLGIMHPIEAMFAARKARKLGLKPCRWFLATLAFGVLASRRLKKFPVVEKESKKSKKEKSGKGKKIKKSEKGKKPE